MIDCQNVKRELTGQERMDTGLGHGSVWVVCGLGYQNNPSNVKSVICEHRGCNPSCPGYLAPDAEGKRPAAADDVVGAKKPLPVILLDDQQAEHPSN